MKSCRIIGLTVLLLLLASAGAASAESVAERTLPAEPLAPGEEFTVTVDVSNYGLLGRVVETLPAGFDYVSQSEAFNASVDEVTNEVTFVLMGTSSFTYNVTAAASEGTYEFTGMMKDSTYNMSDVSGDTAVSVGEDGTSGSTSDTSDSKSSGSSSSGGGGSGASGEAFENIAFKDVKTENIIADLVISYTFDDEQNAVEYINFSALRNYGTVSTTIEVLKDKSAMVDESAPGLVYSNLNIWVGKVGFATEDNIADSVIGFSVSKEWLTENDVNEDSIALYRHSEGKWNTLKTMKVGEDDSYIYFEAETPGFSPFAISANAEEDDTPLVEDASSKDVESDSKTEAETLSDNTPVSESNSVPGISVFLPLILLGCACVFSKRKN